MKYVVNTGGDLLGPFADVVSATLWAESKEDEIGVDWFVQELYSVEIDEGLNTDS